MVGLKGLMDLIDVCQSYHALGTMGQSALYLLATAQLSPASVGKREAEDIQWFLRQAERVLLPHKKTETALGRLSAQLEEVGNEAMEGNCRSPERGDSTEPD